MTKLFLPLLLAALLGLAVRSGPAAADDTPKTAPKTAPTTEPKTEKKAPVAELGKPSPAIVMKDTDGQSFELLDCAVSRKQAEAVVRAAAIKFGAAKDAKLETPLADLVGVKDEDGDLDESLVKNLAVACGKSFGLTATEESAAAFKSLKDLVDWVAAADKAPILLLTWSPRCPSSRSSNDRVIEMIAKTKIRAYALACNARDTDEMYAQYHDTFDFDLRIFPDREQRVTDILGGKTTPHFFLFDAKGVLQYKGAMDNDPMGYMDDEERKDYIMDAVTAIRADKEIALKETASAG